MKYSIYGGTGFVGTEICKDGDFTNNERNSLVSKSNKFVYLISTIHNYHLLDNDPFLDINTNLLHLMKILQVNYLNYGKDFEITFVSSWFVYGKGARCPAKEDDYCNPTGFYSITKRAAEQLLISYCETFGIKWKIVRLANVLGVGDRKVSSRKNALQYMIQKLCDNKTVSLYDAEIYRDYIHVSECADAIRLVTKSDKFGEIYNIGSGRPTKISDAVMYAHNVCNSGNIEKVPVPDFHKLVQVENMWLNVEKIYRDFGWRSKLSMDVIIDELVEHYKNNEKR